MSGSGVGGHAELKGDEALASATGRNWAEWFAILDAAGVQEWPHPEIARWLVEEHGVGGWWAQSVTVGYEQARGRRRPGQRADGSFETNASRILALDLGEALDAAIAVLSRALGREPDAVSRQVKNPSARWRLEDGERLQVQASPLADGRTTLALTRSRLAAESRIQPVKAELRGWLREL